MGAPATSYVPQLLRLLKDPDAGVRDEAAFALGEIAAVQPLLPDDISDAAGPLLKLLRDDPDARVRRSAAVALGSLGADPDQVVPALRERIVKDDSPLVRRNAALALAHLKSQAAPAKKP
jgi:HEAT repeat protein